MRKNSHLTEQELLLMMDGELPQRQAARAKKHLSACWSCRTRLREIESAVANFVLAYQDESAADHLIGPSRGAKAVFKARLQEVAEEQDAGPRRRAALSFVLSGVAVVCLAGLTLSVMGWSYHGRAARATFGANGGGAPVYAEPDARLTPGATRRVSKAEVCSATDDEREPAVAISMQWKVFKEYGLTNVAPENYEVDHLITPALGGSDDLRNLWPEPHSDTVWNSYVKDQLENRLHRMVCDGSVDLTTAQSDIAKDWIAAYKKYLKSESPLPGDLQRPGNQRPEPNS